MIIYSIKSIVINHKNPSPRKKAVTANSNAAEHSYPIKTEQPLFSKREESQRIDILIFTLRNEALSPFGISMLKLPWNEVLNATGISTHTFKGPYDQYP